MSHIKTLAQHVDYWSIIAEGIALIENEERNLSELRRFVEESNRIEGIVRPATKAEIAATGEFLRNTAPDIDALCELVSVLQPDAELRDRPEVPRVRVGNHIAPPSGPAIREELDRLMEAARLGGDPFDIHLAYEFLHPFTDGNGRSGRAIWRWQTGPDGLAFQHRWYYETLAQLQGTTSIDRRICGRKFAHLRRLKEIADASREAGLSQIVQLGQEIEGG